MKGYLYILLCANNEYYVGSTNDLASRLLDHQNGEGANFTFKHLPVEHIYTEEFPDVEAAFKREQQVKKWSRAKKEVLIAGDIEKLKQLSKNHTENKSRDSEKQIGRNETYKCFQFNGYSSLKGGSYRRK